MLKLTRPLAIYDLQTTGVDPATDKIIEISILKVFPDGTREAKTKRLNPGRAFPQHTTAAHGSMEAGEGEHPSFKRIAKGLFAYLTDCDLCTFNGKHFDLPLLANEFARIQMNFPAPEVAHIDVFDIYRMLHPQVTPRTLATTVAHYLGRARTGAHAGEANTTVVFNILQTMIAGPLTAYVSDKSKVTAEELFSPQGLCAFGDGLHQNRISSPKPERAIKSSIKPIRLFHSDSKATKAVDQLIGICSGILADGEVNEDEAIFFAKWARKHAPAEPVWPFTDILTRLERIFADGICDEKEQAELKDVMTALCGLTDAPVLKVEPLATALPLSTPVPYPLFEHP